MATVVCKFKLSGIKRTENGTQDGKPLILSTLEFYPVYPSRIPGTNDPDPNHENSKFWKYSPSGKLELGTVNEGAVQILDLGKEYYILITDEKPPYLDALLNDEPPKV